MESTGVVAESVQNLCLSSNYFSIMKEQLNKIAWLIYGRPTAQNLGCIYILHVC